MEGQHQPNGIFFVNQTAETFTRSEIRFTSKKKKRCSDDSLALILCRSKRGRAQLTESAEPPLLLRRVNPHPASFALQTLDLHNTSARLERQPLLPGCRYEARVRAKAGVAQWSHWSPAAARRTDKGDDMKPISRGSSRKGGASLDLSPVSVSSRGVRPLPALRPGERGGGEVHVGGERRRLSGRHPPAALPPQPDRPVGPPGR